MIKQNMQNHLELDANFHAKKTPKGWILWLTGMPGAGKTTLAVFLEHVFRQAKCVVARLDGDGLRSGLCSDLGFSMRDRAENVRRAAEVSRVVADIGGICIVALITPLEVHRKNAKHIIGEGRYVEVYLETPLAVCRERDKKGNYAKAESGCIKEFTGISSNYEVPLTPCVIVNPAVDSIDRCALRVLTWLATHDAYFADLPGIAGSGTHRS